MRTTISRSVTTTPQSGYIAAPPWSRPYSSRARSSAAAHARRLVPHGIRAQSPSRVRPRAAVVRYARPLVRPSYAPHPQVRVEQARLGLATLALAALVSAAVVVGLLGLPQLRAGAEGGTQTTAVQVQPAPFPGR